MKKFIIRLDDACPTMDRKRWHAIEEILDKYGIKPIVAVIPDNEDPEMKINEYDDNFWNRVRRWQDKGWRIAMHGFNHYYSSRESGLIPINKQSEFAGVAREIQREKIKKAYRLLKEKGVEPGIWVAPSHTFDENTLKILREDTEIRIISDGLAFYPYSEYDFFWIPQQLWSLKNRCFGVWTVCFHPNVMNSKEIENVKKFIDKNKDYFANDIDELHGEYKDRKKNIFDRIFFQCFMCKIFLRDMIRPPALRPESQTVKDDNRLKV